MTYSRVLGTIGLIGATVLGAMGPARVSQTAHASASSDRAVPGARLSPAAAKQAARQALRVGYFTTRNGKHVYLSSALVNNFRGVGGAKASAAVSAGHVASSPPPSINGGTRANQDFGFYLTGNGQLFHNTESVAVDPLMAGHVVVSATDTRLGSDGSIFNTSSNPIFNQTFNPTCFSAVPPAGALTPTPCSLMQALGGPGVYNSTDGWQCRSPETCTDLIIPDTVTGAVPDAINTAACPVNLPTASSPTIAAGTTVPGYFTTAAGYPAGCIAPDSDPDTLDLTPPGPGGTGGTLGQVDTDQDAADVFAPQVQATVGCIPASGAFLSPAVLQQQPGFANACVPYDSVGDQSVAFDSTGALYVVSLGLVSIDPMARASGFTDAPQTDVLLNVSPAIQPVNPTSLPFSPTNQPFAAGRVFNNIAPNPTCNPTASSTTTCLHNEVIVSSASNNFLTPTVDDSGVPGPAFFVGRNYQADDASGNGFGACDSTANFATADFCLIDQPYIAINGVVDPTAYVVYTLFDFSVTVSNVFMTTALVNGAGNGTLPVWTPPVMVDNPGGEEGTGSNPFCNNGAVNFCLDSWGPAVTIGPDGVAYIAYENGDVGTFTAGTGFTNGGDVTNCVTPFGATCNQILVATATQPSFSAPISNIVNETFASEVIDHDVYQAAVTAATDAVVAADPAGLDPDSGAYFTIPNRPSIAVGAPVTLGGVTYSGGIVIVAWTDQRSFPGSPGVANVNSGTRVWYTTGAAKSGQSLTFNLLNRLAVPGTVAPAGVPGTYYIKEVYEPNVVVNQFFPWVTASQFPGGGTTNPDNMFIGFYQEVPAHGATLAPPTSGSPATLTYYVGKSIDGGQTFGVNPAVSTMPLPTTPLGGAYCGFFGFTSTNIPGTSVLGGTAALAACNAVPYFGTYTGIAWDKNNGAYAAWTDTRPNSRNFQVGGSQDVVVAHVS